MAGGRPPQRAETVTGLSGSRQAKRRLKVILETLSGERTVGSAAQELGICESAFFKLRTRTLQEAVEGLEPRAVGRPPTEIPQSQKRIAELEEELAELQRELKASRVREELAIALPYVTRRERDRKKGP